jgi:hypothetical protein
MQRLRRHVRFVPKAVIKAYGYGASSDNRRRAQRNWVIRKAPQAAFPPYRALRPAGAGMVAL